MYIRRDLKECGILEVLLLKSIYNKF